FYNLEYVVLKLLNTNIQHIPTSSAISYKMKSKSEIILEKGEFYTSQTSSTIIDGVSYYIQVGDGKIFNEISYSNPETYLSKYPTVDELISVNEFLDIIKKSFNIFED